MLKSAVMSVTPTKWLGFLPSPQVQTLYHIGSLLVQCLEHVDGSLPHIGAPVARTQIEPISAFAREAGPLGIRLVCAVGALASMLLEACSTYLA